MRTLGKERKLKYVLSAAAFCILLLRPLHASPLIAPAVESLTAIMRRYQITYISGYLRAAREHLALIERIRAKDVAGAQAIMDEHLRVRTAWNPE